MAYAFVICSPSVLDPWEPEIEALAAAGRAKGYLTYEEMNTAAPELAPSPEMMDRILQAMDTLGLEIIDGGDAVRRERAAARARGDVEPVVGDKDRKPSALELPITTEKIDDPVRMYLTQMGEIPLLTRDRRSPWPRRSRSPASASASRCSRATTAIGAGGRDPAAGRTTATCRSTAR